MENDLKLVDYSTSSAFDINVMQQSDIIYYPLLDDQIELT